MPLSSRNSLFLYCLFHDLGVIISSGNRFCTAHLPALSRLLYHQLRQLAHPLWYATAVVGIRRREKQTKESARRGASLSGICFYYVDIFFYCVAQKHLLGRLFSVTSVGPSVFINSCPSVFVNICYESYHLLQKHLLQKTAATPYNGTVCWSRDQIL